MFFGTVWVLVFGRVRAEINKVMLSVAILLLLLSTTVRVERPNILNEKYSPMPIIANYFRHNSSRRRPRIATWHLSRRSSGVLRRRRTINLHIQELYFRPADFTGWWCCGKHRFVHHNALTKCALPSDRFIVATSSGNPLGLS
jgi:hypothetical protein